MIQVKIEKINSSTLSKINSVFVIDAGINSGTVKLFIVGDNGLIKSTDFNLDIFDSSPQWKNINSGISNNLNKIKFIGNGYGLAVGDKGTILYTENFGESFLSMNSGTTENLNDVDFGDCSNVYVVGDKGTFIKSSNFYISNILINNLTIDENLDPGALIGLISSTDSDNFANHSYTITSGSESFEVRGDSLFTKITFNYESNSSSSLTLRSTNSNGKSFTKSFTVNVLDKDEIFDIFLSKIKFRRIDL